MIKCLIWYLNAINTYGLSEYLYFITHLDTELLNSHINNETEQGIQVCITFVYLVNHNRNNWFPANNSSCQIKYIYIYILFQFFKILAEGKAVPEEMMVQLIVDRLKSPDVEHYGKDMTKLK